MVTSPVNESMVVAGLFAELPIPHDATTSRTLINNDVLRVVAFAMGAGQELTEHASTRAVTVQVIEGALDFSVDGVEHRLAQGDVVYLAPGARHALVATSPTRFVLVMVGVGSR